MGDTDWLGFLYIRLKWSGAQELMKNEQGGRRSFFFLIEVFNISYTPIPYLVTISRHVSLVLLLKLKALAGKSFII